LYSWNLEQYDLGKAREDAGWKDNEKHIVYKKVSPKKPRIKSYFLQKK
jgi:hypothetical protein